MARYTITELLTDFQEELAERYEIAAAIRYSRVGDQTELSNSPAYYLEPGAFSADRAHVGGARVRQEIRLLSECAASIQTLDEQVEATVATFERIARDLLKTPSFIQGAFLEDAQSFADAPALYSVESAEGVCNVFGGIAFTFAIE